MVFCYLEPDGVADLFAQLDPHLVRDSLCHGHGGHPPGLGAPDHPVLGVPVLVEVLGQLGRLARPGLADDDDDRVVPDDPEHLGPAGEGRQVLALLPDRLLHGERRLLVLVDLKRKIQLVSIQSFFWPLFVLRRRLDFPKY